MSDMAPLPGSSGVIRVGRAVQRPAQPWTPAVQALLHHLQTVGFDGAPRCLGLTAGGDSLVSYLVGSAPYRRPWPARVWTTELLTRVGQMIRRYHDAVRSFVPESASVWRYTTGGCAAGQIVCHNDLGPTNTVIDEGHVVGFIDWEDAEPGLAEWDLAHAAWWWVPLLPDSTRIAVGAPRQQSQARRLATLCTAYGNADPHQILGLLHDRVVASLQHWDANSRTHRDTRHDAYHVELQHTIDYLDHRLPELHLQL